MIKKRISPIWLAAGLVILLILWLISGDVFRAAEQAPPAEEQGAEELSRVEVREFEQQRYQPELPLQGRVEPWRQVQLLARVAGEVVNLPVAQGTRVEADTVLIELDTEDRAARVAQLEADLEVAEAELEGAERLQALDLASQVERLRLVAERARVQAELEAAQLALRNTQPRAPFAGIFDRRLVELGDYVQVGQELVRFTEINRLRVIAQVPQQDVHRLAVGQSVAVRLLDNSRLQGELRHIATVAEPETRSFFIEVEVDNPELRRVAGGSASLRIELEAQPAHRIPPSLLSLDGDGAMMITYVDESDRVRRQQVQLLNIDREHAWVTGLPPRVRLVMQGAGFIEPGQQVEAVMSREP